MRKTAHACQPPATDNGEAVPTPRKMVRKKHDNIRLYHVDHLGSTSLVTDIDGEITQHVGTVWHQCPSYISGFN